MESFIEVISNGNKERFPIEKGQVKVGRSGTADISIPASQDLELEHFLVAPRGQEGCYVSVAQGATNATKLKGKLFVSGIVKWESEFVVGKTKVRVTQKSTSVGDKPSPIVIVGGVLVVAGAAFLLFDQPDDVVPDSSDLEAPVLFAELPSACDPADGSASELADSEEYRGNAKADRYQYEASDGVAAVFHLTRAALCYQSVGAESDSEELENQASALRGRIESDYATLRHHLSHSIAVEDWQAAASDAKRVSQLVEHLPDDHAYRVWLRDTTRILQAKAEQAQEAED